MPVMARFVVVADVVVAVVAVKLCNVVELEEKY